MRSSQLPPRGGTGLRRVGGVSPGSSLRFHGEIEVKVEIPFRIILCCCTVSLGSTEFRRTPSSTLT